MTPAVSLGTEMVKRTRPSTSAALAVPRVTNWLDPEKLIAPWLETIERPVPGDHAFPSLDVPHPAWFGRWNVSWTRTVLAAETPPNQMAATATTASNAPATTRRVLTRAA